MISDERIMELFWKQAENGSYCDVGEGVVTSFARALLAETADQYRLEGWQAAREQAAKVCDARAGRNEREAQDAIADGEQGEATSLRSAAWQMAVCGADIRAMQPPAEWQTGIPVMEQKQPVADVSLVDEGNNWPHPDGFAGGLTERIKG